MIPSPADLTYFVEVANLLNISKASQNLGISQPSLTLAMQRLEASVGAEILVRHKRGVSLTRAGKQLLAHARLLLQQWDTVRHSAIATMEELQGSFTIGCHPSIGLSVLSRFMPALLSEHPKLEIRLQHDLSRRITDSVVQLSIDIGIVANPAKHPDLVIKKLYDSKVTLWHAGDKRVLREYQAGHATLLCDKDLQQTQSIIKNMKKQNISNARMLQCNNLEVIADLTLNHAGIGILPTHVAQLRQLTAMPHAPCYHDEICVIYRGENRNVKAIQVMTEAIKAAYK